MMLIALLWHSFESSVLPKRGAVSAAKQLTKTSPNTAAMEAIRITPMIGDVQ
jgi:hypothetical protein